jgi:transposase
VLAAIFKAMVALLLVGSRPSPMAAKLALVYRMLRYGVKYVDKGAAFYDAEHRQQQIKHLKRKAASLGYEVTPIPAAT